MRNEVGKKIQPFITQLYEEWKKGNTADFPPEYLLVNMIPMQLQIFPFIGRPGLQIILDKDEDALERFIDECKQILPDYIVQITLKKD